MQYKILLVGVLGRLLPLRVAITCGAIVTLSAGSAGAQGPRRPDPAAIVAFDVPAWAFPAPPMSPTPAGPFDTVTLRHLPGSRAAFTDAQVRNRFAVADWYPGTHAPMPSIVAHGRAPQVIACGYCHLPDGAGRPENARLAGLPARYILRQVAAMKARERTSAWRGPYPPTDLMRLVAEHATASEIADAARYFARLQPRQRSRVVESRDIPRALPSVGLYVPAPGSARESLGDRLVAMPVDPVRHELRDAASAYVTYVPRGSIARGRLLAVRGRGQDVPPCMSCHGAALRGAGQAPPLAGQFPSYLLRQLLAYKAGTRAAPESAPMRAIAARLEIGDVIAVAAYIGSRGP